MTKYKYRRNYSQENIVNPAVDSVLIKRLWNYLKPFRGWIILAIGFLFVSKIIEAYVPIFIGQVSQSVLTHFNSSEEVRNQLLSAVIRSCLWITVVLIIGYSLEALNVYLKSWVGQKALVTLRTQVYNHILHMPLRYFDQHSVGRLMTRTIHDVEQINQMFTESVVPIMGNLLLFFCMCAGIIYLDWRLSIVILIFLPLGWWQTNKFRKNERKCYEMIRSIVSAMNTFVQEHLMGASTVRNFGVQKKEKIHFEEMNSDHCNAYMESIDNFAYFVAAIDLLQSLTLITVFTLLVLYAPFSGGFQAGIFFTFSLYAMMFFRPLADLAERYNVLQSAIAASERIFQILDAPEENANASGIILEGIEEIEFNDVWFAYKDDNWILKGLSLHIKKGESIALVGVTGAGKTSLMSLLMRFYEFQKGSITINGQDIRHYTLESLRRQFSVVLQDPVIFSGTIFENIALYQPGIAREKVEQVIDYMGMRSFIQRFPEGIDRRLTERGTSLSLGQMQLIAMARSVAAERSMLILDEATANIDTATERIIQEALKKILEDKTALVIAHRLSTIKDAKKIVTLSHGVVAEAGTHQELLNFKGIYEKLYRLQFHD